MAATASKGKLARYDLVRLLKELLSDEVDGVLRLSISDLTVRLYIQHGKPVFCVSSSPHHSLPTFLVRQRAVESDVLDEMVDRARQERKRLDEVLRDAGLVSGVQMSALKQSLGQSILSNLFDQETLNYQLDGGRLPPGMDALPLDPARAFYRSLRDDQVFDLKSTLAPHRTYALEKDDDWDAHIRSLTSVFRAAEDVLVRVSDGETSLAMLEESFDSLDCDRLVFAMIHTNMLSVGENNLDEGATPEPAEVAEPAGSVVVDAESEDSAFFLDDGLLEGEFAKLAGDLAAGIVTSEEEDKAPSKRRRRGPVEDDAPQSVSVKKSQGQPPKENSLPLPKKAVAEERSSSDETAVKQSAEEKTSAAEATPPPPAPAPAPAPPAPAPVRVRVPKPPVAVPTAIEIEDKPSDVGQDTVEEKTVQAPPGADEEKFVEDVLSVDDLLAADEDGSLDSLLAETSAALKSGSAAPSKSDSKRVRDPASKTETKQSSVRAKSISPENLPDDPILREVCKDRDRMVKQNAFRVLGVSPGACLSEIRDAHKKLKSQYEPSKYEGRYLPDSSRDDLAAIANRLDEVLRELCVPARRLGIESQEGGPLGKKRIVHYFQAERLYQKGRQQYRGNQKRAALKAFRTAVREYDRDPVYHAWCAYVLWEVLEEEGLSGVDGRVKVREYLDSALALNEDFTMAQLLLARLARHEGDNDTALELYDRVLEANPRSTEARDAVREILDEPDTGVASRAKGKLGGLFGRKKDS